MTETRHTASSEPREHCGHLSPGALLTTSRTECVLCPGHSGSHADERGGRWWPVTEQTRHTASSINDAALTELYARAARAERAALRAEGSEGWMAKHLVRQDSRVHGLTRDRDKWRYRAEQAEAARDRYAAALDRVRALADEHPVGIDTALIHAALDTTAAPTA